MMPFWCACWNAFADLREQLETLAGAEAVPVAVDGDRLALDVLHGKVRASLRRRATVENRRDGRVVHEGQSLPLRLETGDDLRRVHPGLDDLEGNLATNGLRLLREPDLTHATLAEALEKSVTIEGAGGVVSRPVERGLF